MKLEKQKKQRGQKKLMSGHFYEIGLFTGMQRGSKKGKIPSFFAFFALFVFFASILHSGGRTDFVKVSRHQ